MKLELMKPGFAAAMLLCPVWSAHAEVGKVHEHVLGNGLKILVKEDRRAPVVVSQVWYKVGGSYEPGGITGISHMLEHMMFKGTQQYPAGEFSRIIAENGGQENAFTGNDYTAYFQTLEKSRLEISFKLEADRMRNLDLKAEELEKELQVVTEERRMRTEDKPRAKMQEQFNAVAFINSPYKNPVIGWPSDIANYKVEDLQTWYQKWYAPNNATLVVVGDVDAPEVVKLAEQYFAGLKPSEIKPIKPQEEIEQKGARKLTVKAPAKLPYLMLGYKVPVLNTAKPEWEAYALEVLAGILDGGNGARLSSRLVRGKEIAVSAGAGYDMTSRLPDMFLLEATPAEGKSVFDLEYALKEEVNQLQSELISKEELQRIKAQVLANDIYQKDSNFYQAMQLGLLETVGLGWQKADEYVGKINQVTAEQVREVARKYLIDDRLTVAYLDPQPITEAPKPAKLTGGHHAF
ncbi:M16 family metallopeptidase [Methylomonas rapida]|uniref:Pitrilysin family protein n=1 Tax=Methylomonas rapida TaxID=2963939 RepID=A0ABY7GJI6_9GAMM|nr:pitrilysin family protein [Methylomonas rapida]WAR44665.1 pitrilysin family protein [Methylomonas rapida]